MTQKNFQWWCAGAVLGLAVTAVANHFGIHQSIEWGWWAFPLVAFALFNVALFEKT